MRRKSLFLKCIMWALPFFMIPINTYAATTDFQDKAECLSEEEETQLRDTIDEICGELPINVHFITNKDDIDNNVGYLEKHLLEDGEGFEIGFLFDFEDSEYTIAATGETLKYLTNEDIENAYDMCEILMEKGNASIYDCANIMAKHCLAQIINAYNGDVEVEQEVSETIEEVNQMVDNTIVDARIVEDRAGDMRVIIHDLAGLLSPQEEQALINLAKENYKELKYNILFLTTNDTNGKQTLNYSDDYMDLLFPDVEDNIAFVMDMDNRELYINAMGAAIDSIDDIDIQRALDVGYNYAGAQDYYSALNAMASLCLPQLKNPTTVPVTFLGFIKTTLWPALFGSVIGVIILIFIHNKANKTIASTKYMGKDDYKVVGKKEKYLGSYETVQHGYYKEHSSSGSGGSRSISHRSSSGRSHSGGGRKF